MKPLRIRTRIDGETLSLPELKEWAGKTVEIIVEESPTADFRLLETEETLFGMVPPEPSPDERAANLAQLRKQAENDPELSAFLLAVDQDVLDVERIIQMRGCQ